MAKKKNTADSADARTLTTGQYTVLARRYRPQQFAELIGQEAVAQALVNALKSNRVAHAYLFTGARGVGKTSCARILAKALNCVEGPTPTPCDHCENCQAIAVGEDIDVLEIDGASNNKVEEVRELRQNVGLRPAKSRHKIYIIDEVHMLTTSAFNALLKTLEEPPPHVKFIFATTEVQKIPLTILSRCQRFDFTGISPKRIHERLRGILDEEKIEVEPGVLELVARRAGGSMRDAQSLLDQIVAFGGSKITLEVVNRLLGTANEEQIAALAAAVLSRELPSALGQLTEIIDGGIQFGELVDQLLDYWRDLMLVKSAGSDVDGLTYSGRFRDQLRKHAEFLPLDTILAGLDVLATTKGRLRTTSHGRVLVELAIVRLSRLEDLTPLADLARQLSGAGLVPARPTAPAAPRPSVDSAVKKNLSAEPAPVAAPAPLALSPITLPEIWSRTLTIVGPMQRADLENAGLPAISAPNCLVLRFSTAYNTQRLHCEEPTRNARLEEALQRITGQPVAVRYESTKGQAVEVEPPRVPPAEQRRRGAFQEPLVKNLIEQLGASLVQTDEGFGAAAQAAQAVTDSEETNEHV